MTAAPGSVAELSISCGDFIALVDPDGWLAPDALACIEDAILAAPDVDYLYTDEVVHGAGTAVTVLKPDWSLERQRWQDYCGQLSVFRRSLVADVGGLDGALGSLARHDLILRCAERARRIVHLPMAAYHRVVDAATVFELEAAVRPASPAAVRRHLDRSCVAAEVEARGTGCRLRRRSASGRSVSVIVPTAGIARPVWGVTRPFVLGAVRSVLAVTHHAPLEIVVVVDPATTGTVRAALAELPVVLVEGDGPFSFAARCNAGVAASRGELVVLLNDDVLVEQPDWLSSMIGYLAEPDVGVVGARLLHADGTLQHGGILLNEHPRHILSGFAADDPGPFDLLEVAREVSAVTGACLATPRALWDELSGMSPEFPVAFNDIDYCLRAGERGWRTIWTPEATLYHFESQTRTPTATRQEIDRLEARWGHVLRGDPFGNPGFEPGQGWWVERQRPGLFDLARRLAPRRPHRGDRVCQSALSASSMPIHDR